MTILLWVCVALGFAAGFVPRGWLAVPLSLLVGFVPRILGLTWDDGVTIEFLSVWTLAWPAMTALGYLLHQRLFSRRRRSDDRADGGSGGRAGSASTADGLDAVG
ncbi:MAG: hypothetical protein AAF962_13265 [Actinomycetota bacterium]